MFRNIFFFLVVGLLNYIDLTAQDEAHICKYLFSSSNEITQLSTDAISLAVDAVWEASGITGGITTTGTLTQNPNNPDIWTYSSSPNDKLVLNFANGEIVEFIFYSINGYTGGTAEDFKWSHQMDFNFYIQNHFDMRINSNTYPQNGKIFWQRSITGTALFDSQNMIVDISHIGNIQYEIGSGFAFYTYTEQAAGTSSTGSLSINVNEGYWRFIGNNSNNSTFVMNTEITNNSSGNFSGTTYQYQNAKVFWAAASVIYGGYYNMVVDPNDWVAQGTMLKNGQGFGSVQFDGPVLEGTYGPELVLHLGNGTDILIHTLIDFPTSMINNNESNICEFEVMQNYPNPFNSSTKIEYSIPRSSHVSLKIFNTLGEKIEMLVDELKPTGTYEVNWNAANLPSGVYLYQLKAEDFIVTKKMIILK